MYGALFRIRHSIAHQLVNKKNFDNIKMYGMYVRKIIVVYYIKDLRLKYSEI
jgi:hypothetical protein